MMLDQGKYWQEYLCVEMNPDPGVLVIFGASGDLAKRKLFPSLFQLFQRKLIPAQSKIVGCARHGFDNASFRELIAPELTGESDQIAAFLQKITYIEVDYESVLSLQSLRDFLTAPEQAMLNQTFYFALPPAAGRTVLPLLSETGLISQENTPGTPWRHVVFEKPFGLGAGDAQELDELLHRYLREDQIYRIDHYLGKETVQNILMLRFANLIFEPIWNATYIDHVQITVAEELGVEHRAGYYEQAGLLRDMFQNHMLEMLFMVAMEVPAAFEADAIRDEKRKLLHCIRPFDLKHPEKFLVRGQYTQGKSGCAYRDEPGVAPDSATETFVAAKLMIDNWRWRGVPFYLRSGKRMARKHSEIVIVFKRVPHSIFLPLGTQDLLPDVLTLNVQPEEGISLTIQAKKAGPKLCMGGLTLHYNYLDRAEKPLDAYSRLLLDCQLGDQTLFIRSDIIAGAWRLLQPVLDLWQNHPDVSPLAFYPAGTDGPSEADTLLQTHSWMSSC